MRTCGALSFARVFAQAAGFDKGECAIAVVVEQGTHGQVMTGDE